MSIRTLLPALLLSALLPAGVEAATITVWEHENFRGESDVFDTTVSRIDDGWNDRISSLRVDSGQWEVCRDWDFKSCRTVGSDNPEIAILGSGWNDAISSLRPVGSAATATDPAVVAERLYRALLGREPDPEGLRNAAAEVADGKLADLVRGMTQSPEFRTSIQGRPSSEVLDRLYRGLLGRPADAAARTAYLGRIEDGDVTEVVLDLVATDEFASAGSAVVAPSEQVATGEDLRTRGRGTGVVIRGPRNQEEAINSVKVMLGTDGRFRLTIAGTTPHTLEGTYTRESDEFIRVNTIDAAGGSLPAKGGITLDEKSWLGRIDISAGTPGTREHVVYQFVSESFNQAAEVTACEQGIRAKLGPRAKVAFLAPQYSRLGSQRQELRGTVLILSENTSAEYRCELDRSGQVLQASVLR